MFPGQGSQRLGMGRELFESLPQFQAVESQIDVILGYSIRRLCVEDPDKVLSQTLYTQPALYMVNALHYYRALTEGARPDAVIGHSLGEYNALLAAGAFDLITGLRLVKRRAELMAQTRNGSMSAVLGLDAERVQLVLRQQALSAVDIANFNSPAQVVISGPIDELKRAGPILEAAGAQMFVPLPVSAAFHSSCMADTAREFDRFLDGFAFEALRLPVIANVTGQPYPMVDPSSTIRSMLVRQIREPVQWTDSIRHLLAEGASEFKEIGPGNVLTRLIQQIKLKT
jgi:malonyl CoA-acyl carrier protein transacylase